MKTAIDYLTLANGTVISPAELIKRWRTNMMVHSYLYYHRDDSIWSDDEWQHIANLLVDIQELYPEPIGFYDEEFKDWTGATGMHLPTDEWIRLRAFSISQNPHVRHHYHALPNGSVYIEPFGILNR